MAEISEYDESQGNKELRNTLSSSAASVLLICLFRIALLQEAGTKMARFLLALISFDSSLNYKSYSTSVERLGDPRSLE